ncbi:ABC transporter permease [Lentilactobacillus sp. Marseille-Q4993]|uniref:ABC transporter permease n=1 Tax=Lentilactobacillus sp. Marseille-Q4993 TaxID=3039492 RepID=UPI0024BC4BBB|nr:ABC transporter permease [Lentilactobacillus sp. Marseille-Q4993]
MGPFIKQLKFNFKRLYLRNRGYQIGTLLMPVAFYALFTKIMVKGSGPEMMMYSKTYIASMVIYSVLINALFGVAQFLQEDRRVQLVQNMEMTPAGTSSYYLSISVLMAGANLVSAILIQLVAILENGVDLTAVMVIETAVLAVLGTLPIMLVGIAYSYLKSPELLGALSNVTVFPLAMVSGLWWPISIMPKWLRQIGELTPTYISKHILDSQLLNKSISHNDMMGLIVWLLITGAVVGLAVIRDKGGLRFDVQQTTKTEKNI